VQVKTQGIRGKVPQIKEQGFVAVFENRKNDTFISVDDFQGFGKTYERRTISKITIKFDGKIRFAGTWTQLKEHLLMCVPIQDLK